MNSNYLVVFRHLEQATKAIQLGPMAWAGVFPPTSQTPAQETLLEVAIRNDLRPFHNQIILFTHWSIQQSILFLEMHLICS